MCTFRIATNRWDSKAQESVADWHGIVAWDKTAEQCVKYLSKGSGVIVEGRLTVSQWDGPDGRKNSRHEVTAYRVNFVGRGRAGADEVPVSQGQDGDAPAADNGEPAMREVRIPRGESKRFEDSIPF
jgi:single-strand DNA-binding protein